MMLAWFRALGSIDILILFLKLGASWPLRSTQDTLFRELYTGKSAIPTTLSTGYPPFVLNKCGRFSDLTRSSLLST